MIFKSISYKIGNCIACISNLFLAYLRYAAIKNGTNVDSKKLATLKIKVKVSFGVWLTYCVSMTWKFLVDIILPNYVEPFGHLLGIIEERNLLQRFIWIILLQFVQILVEVYALTHYLMLTDLIKKKTAKPSSVAENKWLARIEIRRMEKLSSAVSVRLSQFQSVHFCFCMTYICILQAIRVMSFVNLTENLISLVWVMTPFSFTQTMISTPIFAIINNLALVYVTFRNFGHVRDGLKSMLRTRSISTNIT